MAQEMSFAKALNEAKGVIVQLSNRVKADADKIRTQQQTIVGQSSSITQHESRIQELEEQLEERAREIAAQKDQIARVEADRAAAEQMINRQGEKIGALESANARLEEQNVWQQEQIAGLSQERDALAAKVPSEDDAAALASMTQLLAKAAPVIEKARKAPGGASMRITPEEVGVAEAA